MFTWQVNIDSILGQYKTKVIRSVLFLSLSLSNFVSLMAL